MGRIPCSRVRVCVQHTQTSPKVTSVLAGTCLWLSMMLGELGLVGPLTFTVALYLAVFTLPALYVRSR